MIRLFIKFLLYFNTFLLFSGLYVTGQLNYVVNAEIKRL